MKTCSKCGISKTELEFESVKHGNRVTYRNCCKACRKEYVRLRSLSEEVQKRKKDYYHAHKEKYSKMSAVWMKNNRARLNEQRIIKTYGVDMSWFHRQYVIQGGVCAICGSSVDPVTTKNTHIDHCHTTGKVRGILCHLCNRGIGHFKDSIDTLESAIKYLKANGDG